MNYSSVEYQSGIYSVTFDFEVDANLDTVREIINDDENLHLLSDILAESTIISSVDIGSRQRLILVSACILFYCREVRLVENIKEMDRNLITSRTVPQQSDFRSGEISWRLTELDKFRTRVEFFCKEEPDFWVPPLIGPLLIKRMLLDEAIKVIGNIELISENGRVHPTGS